MAVFSRDELKALLRERDEYCISMFMPTYRAAKETEQGPIRLKNLIGKAEEQLIAQGLRTPEAKELLSPAQGLVHDNFFWRRQSDGLALFISSNGFRCYRLPFHFKELMVLNDRFYVNPLLPLLSGEERFYVLALSQNEIRLIECTSEGADEIELEGVPRNIGEALRYDDTVERHLHQHAGSTGAVGERAAIFHSHSSGGIGDTKDDLLRYFRQIDKGLREIFREERAPLLLAGVEYLLPIYREINTYAHLMDEGITGNPEGISASELHGEAWRIVQPHFQKEQQEAIARYHRLAGTGLASDNMREIVPAAQYGRVEFLFIPLGLQQWGRFDADNNTVHLSDRQEPGDEDLYDFSAIQTILNGGTVYAVKPEEVPGNEHAAAVFRY